jgi:hypothetical protein
MREIKIDLSGKSLGRAAVEVANALIGKGEVTYAPNIVPDVKVTIENLDQIKLDAKKLFNKKYYLDLNENFLDKFKSILKESIINGIVNFKNTDLDFLDITFYPNQTENDINLILSNINLTDFDNLNETLSSEFPGLNIEFGYRYAMRNDYIVSHSLFKNDLERYKIKYSDKLNKPYIDEMDISLDSDGFMNKLLNLMKEVGSNL